MKYDRADVETYDETAARWGTMCLGKIRAIAHLRGVHSSEAFRDFQDTAVGYAHIAAHNAHLFLKDFVPEPPRMKTFKCIVSLTPTPQEKT